MKRFKIELQRQGTYGTVSYLHEANTIGQANAHAIKTCILFGKSERIAGCFWSVYHITEQEVQEKKSSIWKWLLKRQKAK